MPETTEWTKERVINLLQTSNLAVERAILLLYNNQTTAEQQSEETQHDNDRGFCSCDAKWGTRFAKYILKGEERGYKPGDRMTYKMFTKARRRIYHYHRQILEEIQRKQGVSN